MIFIIGTSHSTQYWSDAISAGEDCDIDPRTVHQFEAYLRATAKALRATFIAEELSANVLNKGKGVFPSLSKWQRI
jgi:hypothetical protein